MPAASYTETSVADNVLVSSSRFRVNPSTLDWSIRLQCQIIAANGDVIRVVDVDVATLISAPALANFKASLNSGLAALATQRSITTNL